MIRRYTSSSLSALAHKVMNHGEKNKEFRRNLVAAALDNDAFVALVESEMRALSANSQIVEGDTEPPLLNEQMIENQYSELPLDTMDAMAKVWSVLEKRDASEPGVWAYINTRLVQHGLIDACYFATGENGSDKSKGKRRLEDALKKGGDKEIKDRSLQIIRNWSGAREIRGIREMYQNCSPARAWWTCRLADEAAKAIGKTPEEVRGILRERNTWNRFSERAVSQLTILGDEKIRDGVILFLMEDKASGGSRFLQDESLKKMFRGIGQMSSWRALGFFQSDRVCKIISDEIVPLIKQKS